MKYFCFFLLYFFSFAIYAQNNDLISDAIEISCDTPIESSTSGYTSNQEQLINWGLDPCGTSIDSSPGVWYYLEGNNQDYVLRMCDSNYDTKLHVFADDGFDISCVTGNDDGYICESNYLHSEVSFYASSGYTYYIYVSGYNSAEGDFVLTLYCNPGCIDPVACNYDINATLDTGNCVYHRNIMIVQVTVSTMIIQMIYVMKMIFLDARMMQPSILILKLLLMMIHACMALLVIKTKFK